MAGFTSTTRMHYLDNLRWMAMLLGVFVHAAQLGDLGLIRHVSLVSELFRMALFFMISGYLGALLLDRKSRVEFLSGRMKNLAIPFLASLVLLNPVTVYLMLHYFDDQPSLARTVAVFMKDAQNLKMSVSWHLHLWFLPSLMCFVVMAAVIHPLPRYVARWAEAVLLSNAVRRRLVPFIVVTAGVCVSLAIAVFLQVLADLIRPAPRLMRITLQYVPFYLTGLVLFHAPHVFARMRQTDYVVGGVIALCFVVAHGEYGGISRDGVLYSVVLTALRFWICFFLLDMGCRFLNRANAATRSLTDAIYSVYLFHLLLIYIVASLLVLLVAMTPVTYAIVVGTTIALGLWVHFHVIARSATLRLIFNGR